MSTRDLIELGAAVVMLLGVTGILWTRIRGKGKGIGVRAIQFLAVTLIVPTVLILSLEGVLSSETTAALLGAAMGYVLSGIGKDEPPTHS